MPDAVSCAWWHLAPRLVPPVPDPRQHAPPGHTPAPGLWPARARGAECASPGKTYGPLQHRDGPLHVPLAQIHHTDPMARLNHREGMIDDLGDPEPVFGHGEPLRERTAFGVAVAQPGPGSTATL